MFNLGGILSVWHLSFKNSFSTAQARTKREISHRHLAKTLLVGSLYRDLAKRPLLEFLEILVRDLANRALIEFLHEILPEDL